jgi:predicted nucleic acid-binding protein
MRRVVVDASALAALAFNEPGAEDIARRLEGADVHAPTLLCYELANVAWKKARRDPSATPSILRAVAEALDEGGGIAWCQVPAADAALLALATGLTAYDAAYVWLAGLLGADLVTLDRRVAEAPSPTDRLPWKHYAAPGAGAGSAGGQDMREPGSS